MAGQPIRWDNISGAGLSEASRPLDSAAALFSNAFSGLRDTLKERETIDNANWQNTKVNNTNAYLDAVSKFGSADALRAAQQDGTLDKLRAQYGYQIDSDKVRGAADARVSQLQDQTLKDITFKHAQIDEATAKDVQDFQAARMNGDRDGMAKAMASYTSKNGRDPTSLLKFADERDWVINQRGMTLDKFQQDIATAKDNIRHNQAMEGIQQTQANAQVQQVNNQKAFQDWQIKTADKAAGAAEVAGKMAAYRKELVDSGNLYAKEGIWDGSQSGDFMEALTKNKIGDDVGERSAMIEKLNKIARDGIEIKDEKGHKIVIHDIPVAAARAAMLGSTDQMVNWWNQGYANTLKNNLEGILKGEMVKDGSLTNKMTKDLETYRSMLTDSTTNAQPLRPVLPQAQVPSSRRK
jgi:hypothetical protein